MRKIIIYLMQFSYLYLCFPVLIHGQNIWQQSNGPNSGGITAICITSNGSLLAGTSGGYGIYRSTNNGSTWIKSNFPYHNYGSSVQSIVRNNNGYLFACGYFTGVYSSSDDGLNWIQQADTSISFFSMGAGPNGYLYASISFQGIWKSTNNGVHWVRLNQSGLQYPYMYIERNGYIFFSADYGIMRSTDSGNSWQQVGTGVIYSVTKAFGEDTSGNLYAGNYFGIFKSTNSGTNWIRLTGSPTEIWSLTSDPDGNVYCGDGQGGIFKSINGGNSWIQIYSSPVIGSGNLVWTLASKPNGNVFGGIDFTGLVRTINYGISWERINSGITNGFITCLKVVSGNIIYSGTYNDGLHKSTDNGNSWTLSALPNYNIFSIGYNPSGYLFVSTTYEQGGVYRSSDNGLNWTQINTGLNTNLVRMFETKLPSLVFAATQSGLYKSSNNGDSWSLSGFANRDVTHLLVLENGNLLAGCNGIYRSTNNGISWDSSSLPPGEVTSLVKSPTGFLLASTNHLYRSNNNGITWLQVNNSNFTTLSINGSGYIVGGRADQNTIMLSTDGGYNWDQMNSGIPSNFYTGQLAVDSSGYFYYSTWGSSVYRTISNLISIEIISTRIPNNFSLSLNYPNPFNPVTKIKFDIPRVGTVPRTVRLIIYDVLGREVAALVNEQLKPGTYEVEFDGTNYPSGVYFYKISADGYYQTRKMVLIK